MKRGKIVLSVVFLVLFFNLVSADDCSLSVSLVNQDPYPAIPGDYVKVVFQIEGVSNPSCGVVDFELDSNYPFSLDSGVSNKKSIQSGVYSSNYKDSWVVAYRVRVDENAIDGVNELESFLSYNGLKIKDRFDIEVEDSRTEFEVHVDSYSFDSEKINFEVLNSGENDISALTVEVPFQEGVTVIGSNRIIVGDADSNEENGASFYLRLSKDKPKEIKLNIIYTDGVGIRRTVEENVLFNPNNFLIVANGDKKSSFSYGAFIFGFILAFVIVFIYSKFKKKKEKKNKF